MQAIYQDYQELSLSRSGLKRLYGLSLTLSLLLALLSALVLAIVFSERLSAPLRPARGRHARGGAGRLQPAPPGAQSTTSSAC